MSLAAPKDERVEEDTSVMQQIVVAIVVAMVYVA